MNRARMASHRTLSRVLISLSLAAALCGAAFGQSPTPSPSPSPVSGAKHPSFVRDIIHDQKTIWTAPFRLRRGDLKWLAISASGMAVLIKTDERTSKWVDQGGSVHSASHAFGRFGGAWADLGTVGGFYFAGKLTHDRRAIETGRLAAEALIDSSLVTGALKNTLRRPRPNYYNGEGEFFTGGQSFPSGHASSAWSVATLVAHEYNDHRWVKYGAYAAAAAISFSRYTGRYHFLSEVVAGSAIGFYTGRFVYRAHHDPSIGAASGGDETFPPKGTMALMPELSPLYDARTRTYGVRAVWTF